MSAVEILGEDVGHWGNDVVKPLEFRFDSCNLASLRAVAPVEDFLVAQNNGFEQAVRLRVTVWSLDKKRIRRKMFVSG